KRPAQPCGRDARPSDLFRLVVGKGYPRSEPAPDGARCGLRDERIHRLGGGFEGMDRVGSGRVKSPPRLRSMGPLRRPAQGRNQARRAVAGTEIRAFLTMLTAWRVAQLAALRASREQKIRLPCSRA